MPDQAYDAIVVGARCAGSPTAMLLAQRGYTVLLIDRDSFPSNMPTSTHLIHPMGVSFLRRWGVHDAIAARTAPITRWRVDLQGHILDGAPPEADDGNGVSYSPRRDLLDSELVDAAVAAGAELRQETTLVGLLTANNRVTGVRLKDSSGSEYEEAARIVIGADGPASMVARETDAVETYAEPVVQSNIWTYWRGVPLDHVQLYFREKAGAFAMPSSDGTVLIAANLMIDDFARARPDRDGAYHAMLERVAPELEAMTQEGEQADKLFAACTRAFVRRAWGPGWVLVGDAGIKKDPVTAQGITATFICADMLARSLDAGLSGECEVDEALDAYEQERDEQMIPHWDFTARLSHFDRLTPEQDAMYERIATDRTAVRDLFGVVSLAKQPEAFFTQYA